MIARACCCFLLMFACARAVAGIDVNINGLDDAARKNVEARLSIKDAAKRKGLDQAQVERLHGLAENEIRTALQPFGYYSPKLQATLTGAAPRWQARYQIDPGPPTYLRVVEITLEGEGADFAPLKAAAAQPLIHQGAQLDHRAYEATKTRLLQLAYANGFLDAEFTRAELRVQPDAQAAQALLTLDSGARYFFGPVTVEQQGLKPGLVERYVRIEPGAPYDPQAVLDTQFALTDLDYFQSIEMQPQRDAMALQHLPIIIKTTPRPRTRYTLGTGYGTDTGARLTAGVEFRRLNASGHKLRLDTRLSQIKNLVGAEYRIPIGDKPTESISFTAASIAEKFEDGKSSKFTLGASLNRTPGAWQRRLYLNYEHERSNLVSDQITSDLVLPGVSLSRGEFDDPIHTRRGWNVFLDTHGAHHALASTATFLQTRLVARGAYPLSERLHLLARTELGASFVADFSELPASQRFYAGGDQSVRGYAYQSLGPRDASGRVIGGRYLTVLSGELDCRLIGNWGVAAFLDAGGADNDPGPKLSRGVGLGARYRAPIGYINVDVAHPLDGDDSGVRLHLSVRVGL